MSTIVVGRGTAGKKRQLKLKGYVIAEKSWNEFSQALKQLFQRYSVGKESSAKKKAPAKRASGKKKRPAKK